MDELKLMEVIPLNLEIMLSEDFGITIQYITDELVYIDWEFIEELN